MHMLPLLQQEMKWELLYTARILTVSLTFLEVACARMPIAGRRASGAARSFCRPWVVVLPLVPPCLMSRLVHDLLGESMELLHELHLHLQLVNLVREWAQQRELLLLLLLAVLICCRCWWVLPIARLLFWNPSTTGAHWPKELPLRVQFLGRRNDSLSVARLLAQTSVATQIREHRPAGSARSRPLPTQCGNNGFSDDILVSTCLAPLSSDSMASRRSFEERAVATLVKEAFNGKL